MIFNGVNLIDFQTHSDDSQLFTTPTKEVEFFSIPGRNGDLSISKEKFANLTKSVNCFIREDFVKNYSALMDYLYSVEGYGKIEYDAEPDVYLLGQFVDAIAPQTGAFLKYGSFTLNFNCQPQKWLKSGDIGIPITNTTMMINPSRQVAKPLIECVGTGTITINDSEITLNANTSVVWIDCDLEDAYEGTINRNPNITVTGGFPRLIDENTVSVSGFTSVKLYPRWWKI